MFPFVFIYLFIFIFLEFLYFIVHASDSQSGSVGNYAAHHMHIFSCALDKKRYYYHLLHTVARGLFHHH